MKHTVAEADESDSAVDRCAFTT